MLLNPKRLDPIKDQDGEERVFVVHKVPAIPMREIVATYPVANMPKLGEYKVSEEIMLKLLAYVGVETSAGTLQMLTSPALINNHCGDWEVLAKVEFAALQHNISFLRPGVASASLTGLMTSGAFSLSSIQTVLSRLSSLMEKQPSTS